mmetsp:Transcript_18871/g.61697  ORF Transcript_18871/g.61697 Transcript_18871/m.61697 type:complete len:373 (-) Transcript_18871:708-1826(-)
MPPAPPLSFGGPAWPTGGRRRPLSVRGRHARPPAAPPPPHRPWRPATTSSHSSRHARAGRAPSPGSEPQTIHAPVPPPTPPASPPPRFRPRAEATPAPSAATARRELRRRRCQTHCRPWRAAGSPLATPRTTAGSAPANQPTLLARRRHCRARPRRRACTRPRAAGRRGRSWRRPACGKQAGSTGQAGVHPPRGAPLPSAHGAGASDRQPAGRAAARGLQRRRVRRHRTRRRAAGRRPGGHAETAPPSRASAPPPAVQTPQPAAPTPPQATRRAQTAGGGCCRAHRLRWDRAAPLRRALRQSATADHRSSSRNRRPKTERRPRRAGGGGGGGLSTGSQGRRACAGRWREAVGTAVRAAARHPRGRRQSRRAG